MRNIVDFSKQTLDSSATDVAQVLIVPADTTVLSCFARVITAETADACVNLGYGSNVDQWGQNLNMDATGIVPTILTAAATFDAGSIADGDEEAKEVTVAGAALGDYAYVIPGIDVADLVITATVTAEDTITVILANNTGGAIDLASQTLTVYVDKAPLSKNPVHFAAADTIDISTSTTNGDIDLDALKVEVTAICIKQLDAY